MQRFYSMQQLCLQQLLYSYSVLLLSMVRHTSWFISASVLLWDLYRYAPHWLTVVFMWIRVTLLKKLGYKCFPSVHFGLVWQVMSVKALGIALKLTFSGMNQLVYPQTWVFLFVVVSCIVTQMNYLNKVCSILWSCTVTWSHMNWKFVLCLSGLKNICLVDIVFCSTLFSTCQNYILQALDTFNTAVVSPIYYTMFTSLTILASVIMFKVTDSDLNIFFCMILTKLWLMS